MALLADGGLNTADSLRVHDSGVLDVTTSESIEPGAKLALALAELMDETSLYLAGEGSFRIEQVAVNPCLIRWHACRTLALIYRDAYFSQHNDRYGERWRHWEQQSKLAREVFVDLGVPIVANPLRRPESPAASWTAGEFSPATYWIQITAVDSSGQESAPSEATAVSVTAAHQLSVSAPGLDPAAAGWNLYIGPAEGQLHRQNSIALDRTSTWQQISDTATSAAKPGEGQAATIRVYRRRRLPRG